MQRSKLLALSGLYWLTRLINLGLLPIFNDEAIYIDWGQQMLESGNFFFPLADGKQPLLMPVFGMFANLSSDPLVGARLVSVALGWFTLMGICRLGKTVFNEKIAIFAAALYIIGPIFLFFDRQALMESAIEAIGVWSLYFLMDYLETRNAKSAVWMGVLWGFGLFVKSTAVIFVLVSFVIVAIVKRQRVRAYLQGLLLSLGIAFLILLPLLSQPQAMQIIKRNDRYSLTPGELIGLPLGVWIKNARSLVDIVFWQALMLLLLPVFLAFKKDWKDRKKRTLALWFGLGMVIYVLTVRNSSPRYLVAFLPVATILAASGLVGVTKTLKWPLVVLSLLWLVYLDVLLLINPIGFFQTLGRHSWYSQESEYLGGFPSGYGVKEALDYVVDRVGGQPAIVGVRPDSGNPENAAFVYSRKHKNIQVTHLTSGNLKFLGGGDVHSLQIPVYFIAREKHLAGLDQHLELEKEFYKPDGKSYVAVYKLRRE